MVTLVRSLAQEVEYDILGLMGLNLVSAGLRRDHHLRHLPIQTRVIILHRRLGEMQVSIVVQVLGLIFDLLDVVLFAGSSAYFEPPPPTPGSAW